MLDEMAVVNWVELRDGRAYPKNPLEQIVD
jgi:hypothetical protein